jgi:hypothetical protein
MVGLNNDTPGAVDIFVKKSLAIAAGLCYTVYGKGEVCGICDYADRSVIISRANRKVNGLCGFFLRVFRPIATVPRRAARPSFPIFAPGA